MDCIFHGPGSYRTPGQRVSRIIPSCRRHCPGGGGPFEEQRGNRAERRARGLLRPRGHRSIHGAHVCANISSRRLAGRLRSEAETGWGWCDARGLQSPLPVLRNENVQISCRRALVGEQKVRGTTFEGQDGPGRNVSQHEAVSVFSEINGGQSL